MARVGDVLEFSRWGEPLRSLPGTRFLDHSALTRGGRRWRPSERRYLPINLLQQNDYLAGRNRVSALLHDPQQSGPVDERQWGGSDRILSEKRNSDGYGRSVKAIGGQFVGPARSCSTPTNS